MKKYSAIFCIMQCSPWIILNINGEEQNLRPQSTNLQSEFNRINEIMRKMKLPQFKNFNKSKIEYYIVEIENCRYFY